ncbi:IclR family transcriptional regulator [Pseudactinotalea terrae]|uniref:IclR family transcriptional regulator n=1 Tax=Pseudactinotalea terrae TaxID=1743262 RepID=UPI0012E2A629|nr:IclR family transcriptional regulator [Pseudactinotalea terrae]
MVKAASLDGEVTSVKSARRLMLVLEYLAEVGPAPFAQIVRDLDLPNSSGHQLLATMVDGGFLEHDEQARSYRLGPRLWAVAQAFRRTDDLTELAQPLMRALVDEVGETTQLSVLEGRHNVYLAVVNSPHPMRLASAVGRRLPAHATGLGKVLLSGLPDEEIAHRLDGVDLERFTEQTRTSLLEVMTDVDLIRARGYGEDNEEFVIGCKCVAMPVRDPSGQVVAAMSVTVPTPRLTDALLADIHRALSGTVVELERRLP